MIISISLRVISLSNPRREIGSLDVHVYDRRKYFRDDNEHHYVVDFYEFDIRRQHESLCHIYLDIFLLTLVGKTAIITVGTDAVSLTIKEFVELDWTQFTMILSGRRNPIPVAVGSVSYSFPSLFSWSSLIMNVLDLSRNAYLTYDSFKT